MTTRQVTELDFRRPEFRDAKVEDYEFRADGALVRKDRWECGIKSIRYLVGVDGRSFEVDEVVDAVRVLAEASEGWLPFSLDAEERPNANVLYEVRLEEGSVLCNVRYDPADQTWRWRAAETMTLQVVAWREQREPAAAD